MNWQKCEINKEKGANNSGDYIPFCLQRLGQQKQRTVKSDMYKIVFNGLACWNYSSTLVTVRVKVFETLCLRMPTCHFCSLAEHITFLFKWLSRLKQLESVSIPGLCDVIKTCNRRRRLHLKWSCVTSVIIHRPAVKTGHQGPPRGSHRQPDICVRRLVLQQNPQTVLYLLGRCWPWGKCAD